MTWQAVARKDFQDAIRSRWLWALSVLFMGLIGGSAYFFATNISNGTSLSSDSFIGVFGQLGSLFIPLVAIVVAYAAIIGERESGSLKLLLSLPHSRSDVVIGKALGRSSVVAVPIFLGFAIAGIVFLFTGVSFAFGNFLAFSMLSVLLGAVFVGIAIGFSAGSRSRRRAMVGSVGAYFLFSLFWQFIRRGVLGILIDGSSYLGLSEPETPLVVGISLGVKYLNPVRAYETLAASLYSTDQINARLYDTSNQILQQIATQVLGESFPVYLETWFITLIFVVWLTVPPVVGFLLFQDADLA